MAKLLNIEGEDLTYSQAAKKYSINESYLRKVASDHSKEYTERWVVLYFYADRRPEPCKTCVKYRPCSDKLAFNKGIEQNAWPILFGNGCYQGKEAKFDKWMYTTP